MIPKEQTLKRISTEVNIKEVAIRSEKRTNKAKQTFKGLDDKIKTTTSFKMHASPTKRIEPKFESPSKKPKISPGIENLKKVISRSLCYLFENNISLNDFFEKDIIKKNPYERPCF